MKLPRLQLLALEDIGKGRLRRYRKGYALSQSGPFHSQKTIHALERAGYVKVSDTGASRGARLQAERKSL